MEPFYSYTYTYTLALQKLYSSFMISPAICYKTFEWWTTLYFWIYWYYWAQVSAIAIAIQQLVVLFFLSLLILRVLVVWSRSFDAHSHPLKNISHNIKLLNIVFLINIFLHSSGFFSLFLTPPHPSTSSLWLSVVLIFMWASLMLSLLAITLSGS